MTVSFRGRGRVPKHVSLALVLAVAAGGLGATPLSAAAPLTGPAPLPSFALPAEATLATDSALSVNDTPAVPGEIDLGAIEDAGLATASTLTAEQWNLQDLEWSLKGDPYAAFAFVRDRIRNEPYAGVLRGAQGTLSARAGNAFDRAVLLKTLLDSMLVPARYAFGTLDDATASRVAARTFEAPMTPLQDAGIASVTPLDPTALVTRARRDYARIRLALGDRIGSLPAAAPDPTLAEIKQHVWVQMAVGPTWVDLDPTLPDATPGMPLVAAANTAISIPPEDVQTVQVQLIADVDSGGQLATSTVLDHAFTSADDAISESFLYFQPDVSGLGGTILNSLTGITGFQPELLINGQVTSGSTFTLNASGLDVFGNSSGVPVQLAGLRLVITNHLPGETGSTTTKVLLDRVPPALAGATAVGLEQLLPLGSDAGGAFALQPIYHILISNGSADPRDHAIQEAQVADFGGELIDSATASEYAMQDVLWPMAVADKALALTSERAIVSGLSDRADIRAVIAQPRVYITSIGPDPSTAGGIAFNTDLALDGVRIVSSSQSDATLMPSYQIWYGALQSAMESEYGLRLARSFDASARHISGASFANSQASLDIVDAATLPASAAVPLQAAARRGELVLVAGDVATTTVWWTIDAGGVTRSVLEPSSGGIGGTGKYTGLRQRPPVPRGGSPGYGNKFKMHRTTPPPSRCGGGQEYVAILGCVSVPAAWALRVTVGVAVAIAAQYAWTTLVIN